jgi:putative oxidoreductase
LEQYAILLIRVSLGLFFAISGANKLFVAGGTKTIYETLVKAKVPFPHQMAYFVSGVEFVGGSLLTVGFLSSPACMALLIDMIVAILTNTLSTMPKGLSPLNRLDDILYLPEVLYVLFKSVRLGHQRVAMKTLRTYFSELVYGELQSPIGSRLLHRRARVPRERSGNAEQFGTIFSCSLLGASPMEAPMKSVGSAYGSRTQFRHFMKVRDFGGNLRELEC